MNFPRLESRSEKPYSIPPSAPRGARKTWMSSLTVWSAAHRRRGSTLGMPCLGPPRPPQARGISWRTSRKKRRTKKPEDPCSIWQKKVEKKSESSRFFLKKKLKKKSEGSRFFLKKKRPKKPEISSVSDGTVANGSTF